IRAHLAAHGVEVVEEGQRYGADGTGFSLYVRDPRGNTVELKGPSAYASADIVRLGRHGSVATRIAEASQTDVRTPRPRCLGSLLGHCLGRDGDQPRRGASEIQLAAPAGRPIRPDPGRLARQLPRRPFQLPGGWAS